MGPATLGMLAHHLARQFKSVKLGHALVTGLGDNAQPIGEASRRRGGKRITALARMGAHPALDAEEMCLHALLATQPMPDDDWPDIPMSGQGIDDAPGLQGRCRVN
jgi:hypothetical protein